MNILTGLNQLITSPSGLFSLISLAVITIVTWHVPEIGAGAFMAFFAITPSLLIYAEHKEQMQTNQILPPINTVVTTIVDNIKGRL